MVYFFIDCTIFCHRNLILSSLSLSLDLDLLVSLSISIRSSSLCLQSTTPLSLLSLYMSLSLLYALLSFVLLSIFLYFSLSCFFFFFTFITPVPFSPSACSDTFFLFYIILVTVDDDLFSIRVLFDTDNGVPFLPTLEDVTITASRAMEKPVRTFASECCMSAHSNTHTHPRVRTHFLNIF